jgi:hypothetical protein
VDGGKLIRTEERGVFPPLTDPEFVTADNTRCRLIDLTLGIERFSEAKAYPLSREWLHGYVNEMLCTRAVLVAYCPFSSARASFDPLLAGIDA